MMAKRRGMIFIALGITLAAAVGALVFVVIQNAANGKTATSDVVVAAQDIPDRTAILPGAVAIKRMPVDVIPAGAISKTDDVVGRMTPSKIYAGEMILKSKLVDSKGQTGLSFTMSKGRVLVTFPASSIIGLGLVRPGDAVDILVTYHPAKAKNASQPTAPDAQLPNITQTTMQNLKVVTIGGQATTPPTNTSPPGQQAQPSFVTFAAEPQDALTLKAMKDSEELTIELALRAAGDEQVFKTEPVTLKGVLERYGVRSSP